MQIADAATPDEPLTKQRSNSIPAPAPQTAEVPIFALTSTKGLRMALPPEAILPV